MARKKKVEEVKEVQTLEQTTIVGVVETPAVEEAKAIKTTITKEEYMEELGKFLSDREWIFFAKSMGTAHQGYIKYSTGVLFNIILKHNSRKMSPESRITLAKVLKGIYIIKNGKRTEERFKAVMNAIDLIERLDEDFKDRLKKTLSF